MGSTSSSLTGEHLVGLGWFCWCGLVVLATNNALAASSMRLKKKFCACCCCCITFPRGKEILRSWESVWECSDGVAAAFFFKLRPAAEYRFNVTAFCASSNFFHCFVQNRLLLNSHLLNFKNYTPIAWCVWGSVLVDRSFVLLAAFFRFGRICKLVLVSVVWKLFASSQSVVPFTPGAKYLGHFVSHRLQP